MGELNLVAVYNKCPGLDMTLTFTVSVGQHAHSQFLQTRKELRQIPFMSFSCCIYTNDPAFTEVAQQLKLLKLLKR